MNVSVRNPAKGSLWTLTTASADALAVARAEFLVKIADVGRLMP
jgi:hypothetical protein